MFARIGAFASRFRWFIIAAWVAVAIVLTLVAPNINSVAVNDQRAFLPSRAPSLYANDVMKQYFPDRVSPSSAVLVIDTGSGGRVDQGAAADYVAQLTDWLNAKAGPELAAVDDVMSPTLGDQQTKASLTSQDKQVALVLVRFNAIGTTDSAKLAIAAIGDRLNSPPPGVTTYMTGDGPILAAYNTATQNSIASTTWITILLVVVILLLIYRSPVSPFIPLITIALAYLISRGVIAFLGAGPLTISSYTNIFLIVVLFGAGTDYCLFLISRFREEMSGAQHTAPAVRTTVRAVGETIASSAGTVIVGLAMMVFAELGLYNTTGPSIAIGVAIALLAGLTLTPAMLTVLGHHAFWPRKAQRLKERGIWAGWASRVARRPVLAFFIPVIVLVPLAIYGGGLSRDFDLLGDLPKNQETRVGFNVLADHFGAGQMLPLTVVVVDSTRMDSPSGLAATGRLAAQLSALPQVAQVRSFTGSLPDQKTLNVDDQLTTVKQGLDDGVAALKKVVESAATSRGGIAASGLSQAAASIVDQLQSAAAELTDVGGYVLQLGAAYPDAAQTAGYSQAIGALSELQKLAGQLGSITGSSTSGRGLPDSLVQDALTQLDALSAGLGTLQGYFAAQKPDAVLLPDLYLKQNSGLQALRDAYVSKDGTAARLQVVLNVGPYSPAAIAAVQGIRQTLASDSLDGVVEGNSAVLLDLRDASNRDLTKTMIFVLSGIFVVLLLLLRAVVAPIYLILTILLSYGGTLGVMRLLFVNVMHTGGVTWWVPMFMFVMLVALGMDYNIFLIGRVKEEVAASGTRQGVQHALARTGGIITSAGIIMAGTFASMMSGSILGLLQIGFAVAFGVLLDTFVVRTTLVPAIIVLLGRWSWWPRRGPVKRR